jgi:hypothetical protein
MQRQRVYVPLAIVISEQLRVEVSQKVFGTYFGVILALFWFILASRTGP